MFQSARFHPALVMRCEEQARDLELLELPSRRRPDVVVIVGREPHRARTLRTFERARLQELPLARRTVAVHFDNRIHHLMGREAEDLGRAAKEAPDRLAADLTPEITAIPDGVLDEEPG